MDCVRSSYYSPLIPCSGYGICNFTNGFCECFPGISSSFNGIEEGYDCDQLIVQLKVLGLISAILNGLVICLYIKIILKRYSVTSGDKLNPLLCCPIFHTLQSCHHFVFSLLQYIDPTRFSMGTSVVSTYAMCGGVFFFCSGASNFLLILSTFFSELSLRLMPAAARSRINGTIRIHKFIHHYIYPISFVTCFIVMLGCVYPKKLHALISVICLSHSFLYVYILTIAVRGLHVLNSELHACLLNNHQHSNLDVIKSAKQYVYFAYFLFASFGPMTVVSMLLVGIWPFLTRKFVYAHLIYCIVGPSIACAYNLVFCPRNTFPPLPCKMNKIFIMPHTGNRLRVVQIDSSVPLQISVVPYPLTRGE